MIHGRTFRTFLFGAALLAAAPAWAAGPQWMPGFPMRMGTNVMLMWTPVPGATGYNVYKSDKPGVLGPLLISLPANNHMDANVTADKSAYYTVKVVTGGAEGDAGPVGALVAVKPLDAPKWIGHMEQDKNVVLRFDAVTGAAFYNVLRAEKAEGPFALVASIQESKYTDTNVSEGNSYFYQVSAVDKNNTESPKSAVYEFKFEKKAAATGAGAAKTYTQVDILVKPVTSLYGPDTRPFQQPAYFTMDGQTPVMFDGKSIAFLNPADDTVVKEYTKPEGYSGEWGRTRGIAMASDGVLLTTWVGGTQVRGLGPDGSVNFEFDLAVPTEEEYAKLDRQADWTEDSKLKPLVTGVAEDGEGRIWVGEPIFGQMHLYDRSGKLLAKIGEPRVRSWDIKGVKSLSIVRYHKGLDRMYVLDPIQGAVRAYDCKTLDFVKDAEGKPVYGWKRSGSTTGYFQEPRGIGVLKDGNLVITDGIDGRIQVYDPEMEYKGSLVTEPGQPKITDLGGPIDVGVDGDTLYIAEPLNQRVTAVKF